MSADHSINFWQPTDHRKPSLTPAARICCESCFPSYKPFAVRRPLREWCPNYFNIEEHFIIKLRLELFLIVATLDEHWT